MEGIVRQFGYLPELYYDARSEKYKILWDKILLGFIIIIININQKEHNL
jgi:hypothetical protein